MEIKKRGILTILVIIFIIVMVSICLLIGREITVPLIITFVLLTFLSLSYNLDTVLLKKETGSNEKLNSVLENNILLTNEINKLKADNKQLHREIALLSKEINKRMGFVS